MRSPFDLFADNASDLVELLHQVGLSLQSAGRIENADVVAFLSSFHGGFVSDRSWVSPLITENDIAADPFRPNLELLNRSGAKSVACSEQYTFALTRQSVSQLGNGGRLTRSVDTTTKITVVPCEDIVKGDFSFCNESLISSRIRSSTSDISILRAR